MSKYHKIGIIGSRRPKMQDFLHDLVKYEKYKEKQDKLIRDVIKFVCDISNPYEVTLVCSDSPGVEYAALETAKTLGIHVCEFVTSYEDDCVAKPSDNTPPWLKRNIRIANECDEIHFWPGEWSTGTQETMKYVQENNSCPVWYLHPFTEDV